MYKTLKATKYTESGEKGQIRHEIYIALYIYIFVHAWVQLCHKICNNDYHMTVLFSIF